MSDRTAEIESVIPPLRRFAVALTRDRDLADDLVQDALERALSRWALRRPGSPLRPWLFTILRNLFISGRRRAARDRALFDDRADGAAESDFAAAPEDAMALREAFALLDALPEEQREVVLLASVEGFTYDETARIVGAPVGTVMSRLARARRRMREAMDRPRESGGTMLKRVK